MAQVSLIVPLYQVEACLEACLQSLCTQTFSDIEIICVDDGSVDQSGTIADTWAAQDNRIRVIHQQNQGLSAARNRGIEAATAPIIMFVDGDDRLKPYACETIVQRFADQATMTATPLDMLTFAASTFPDIPVSRYLIENLHPQNHLYSEHPLDALYAPGTKPFVWRCAFSQAFLRRESLTFQESLRFGEDLVFLFEAYAVSNKTLTIDSELYEYRLGRQGSLMQKTSTEQSSLLEKHLVEVDAILHAWQNRGLLTTHGAPALDWCLSFVGPDIFELPGSERNILLPRLRNTLLPYVDKVAVDELEPGTQAFLQRILNERPLSSLEAKRTLWSYYRHRKGIRFCISKLLGREG